MPLKLYYASGACSFVPHTMLELAGATFEPVAVKLHKGEHNSPEYRAINPRGQVPALAVDGDKQGASTRMVHPKMVPVFHPTTERSRLPASTRRHNLCPWARR